MRRRILTGLRRSHVEKVLLVLRTRLRRLTGRAAMREPVPPMYPGALRLAEAEVEAVTEAAREVVRRKRLFRHWGIGPRWLEPSVVADLERAFARRTGVSHAIALNSGTSALVCGLVGLGVGAGDEVVVPAYAWLTVCTAVLAVGAVPVVAEIDDSLTLDVADAERRLTARTKAVIAVHMRGAPCDMEGLLALAARHDLLVLEDVAQATGGSYRGRPLGSLGDAGAFSLQFNKIITCGEGGVLVTHRDEVHRRAELHHDATAVARRQLPPAAWLPGLNLRMSELQGAVARAQLDRLDGLLAAMRAHKTRLLQTVATDLAAMGVLSRTLHDAAGDTAIAVIFFLPDAGTRRTSALADALVRDGVPASRLYHDLRDFPADLVDLHTCTAWQPLLPDGGEGELAPRTVALLRRAIQIDISPDLTVAQVDAMAGAVAGAVRREL